MAAVTLNCAVDTDLARSDYPPNSGIWFKEFIDHRDPHPLGPPLRPDPHESYSALSDYLLLNQITDPRPPPDTAEAACLPPGALFGRRDNRRQTAAASAAGLADARQAALNCASAYNKKPVIVTRRCPNPRIARFRTLAGRRTQPTQPTRRLKKFRQQNPASHSQTPSLHFIAAAGAETRSRFD